MAKYFAYQIILRKPQYNSIIKKFHRYKDEIDFILASRGWTVNEEGELIADSTPTEPNEEGG